MGKPIHAPDAPEFQTRSVEVVRASELSKAQAARDLDITPETLRL